MTLMGDFGKRLREMRKGLRMSQTALAEEIGDGNTDTLSRLERGAASQMSVGMVCGLAQFARRHGVSLEWLFSGHGPADRTEPAIHNEAWLMSTPREELLSESLRLSVEMSILTQLLNVADDAKARAAVVRAILTHTSKERR